MYWLAVNYQQDFYEISSDFNQYKCDEHHYIRNFIGYAIYGPPEIEDVCEDIYNVEYEYKQKGAKELIKTIYEKIVQHGTQQPEGKDVLCMYYR